MNILVKLEEVRLRLLIVMFILLTAIDLVLTTIGWKYEVGPVARLFMSVFPRLAWELYFSSRIIVTSVFVILIYFYASPKLAKTFFLILNLILWGVVILNVYFLIGWGLISITIISRAPYVFATKRYRETQVLRKAIYSARLAY